MVQRIGMTVEDKGKDYKSLLMSMYSVLHSKT